MLVSIVTDGRTTIYRSMEPSDTSNCRDTTTQVESDVKISTTETNVQLPSSTFSRKVRIVKTFSMFLIYVGLVSSSSRTLNVLVAKTYYMLYR